MTASACVLVGLIGVLVYHASTAVVTSHVARLALVAVVVLVPLAAEEAITNTASLHWYFLFLTPFVLLTRAVGRSAQVLWAVLALVAAMTEPQVLVFAPLAVVVFIREPRSRLLVGGWALGLAAQAVSYLSDPRPR